MDIVVANGFVMERCTFFSREYHCCVLHNTRCKCEDYNPRNSKPLTNADKLRAMSDEELAWELCRICRMPFYKDDSEIDEYEVDCWVKWLKQEASDAL